jgi:apolipoprotein N-acyltransferase
VGGAGLAFLLVLAVAAVGRAWRRRTATARVAATPSAAASFSADVVVLTPAWRLAAGVLRLAAAAGLLALFLLMLLRDGLQVNSLAQIQLYVSAVLAPALVAWAIQRTFAATATVEGGLLVLRQRTRRIEIPVASIASMRLWRVPLPGSGVDLGLASGRRWTHGIRLADPLRLLRALGAAGGAARLDDDHSRRIADYASARAAAARRWLDHALVKFALFPLVPALPAFRLHQHIAFGGTFGEYYTYGLKAWLIGLLIWWAARSIGLMLFAALLRIASECAVLPALWWRPALAADVRHSVEWLGRVAFYLGVPAWLLVRILVG